MRKIAVLSLMSALVGTGCFGRANPRVKEMSVKNEVDGFESTKRFRYDDEGRPLEIVGESGASRTTMNLVWDSDLLAEMRETSEADGSAPSTRTTKLEYEGTRLMKAVHQHGVGESNITVGYDETGRLAEVRNELEDEGTRQSEVHSFDYDDSGALVTLRNDAAFESNGDRQSFTSKREIAYENGKVADVLTTSGDSDLEEKVTASYEDDRLAALELLFTRGDEDTRVSISYDYDDAGRIAGAVARTIGSESLTEVEVSYEEGEAQGVDVAPLNLLLLPLWDLKGASFSQLDNRLQIARILEGGAW